MTDERTMLLKLLASQRRHVVATMIDAPESFLLVATLPSQWSPAGLIHHLTHDVERFWFRKVLLDDPEWHGTAAGVEAWDVPAGTTGAELVAAYQTEVAKIDEILATVDLDAPPQWWDDDLFGNGGPANLREILFHVITETATHAGQMDIVRELHDGRQHMVLTDETRPGRRREMWRAAAR